MNKIINIMGEFIDKGNTEQVRETCANDVNKRYLYRYLKTYEKNLIIW